MTVFDRIETPACSCDEGQGALPSVPDALHAALCCVSALGPACVVPLSGAHGRVLAADVRAAAAMPRFDTSGMDGYALLHSDLAAGKALPLDGVAAAGSTPARLQQGRAMRIYTGAPVPEGADTVVMQEAVQVLPDGIHVLSPPQRGTNIRRSGEDLAEGAPVVPAGTCLGPGDIAACAAAGAGAVSVAPVPRIGLVLTGDELRKAGAPLGDGGIWDINTPMLTAAVAEAGCAIGQVLHVPDTRAALERALADMRGEVDMIITSGGASVGDRDHVPSALRALGAEIALAGAAIKPGKPVMAARLDQTPILGLPGNPVSAFVIWQVFGRAMGARMQGRARAHAPLRHVRLTDALTHKPGRCEYRPARIAGHDADGFELVSCPAQTHSARVNQIREADGLILLPVDCDALAAGAMAEFLPF
ncbi:MAG: molybdopterin molybdotransferase MoeA [Sediminimonas qiaohouensis]|uniref:Molybdopterin molybdenumtransferase n=1 Tax=Sediminimonas qiaohouensis TaxID=552061 RepID=A0A7C9H9T1_9RHOB|nr:gephyrin-like molybdotransferase Glp [Sediminimonas qiaohouensis]MTJ03370.1 molybdopterin molybdotransferase MoeA [Sediminimonas qiaohouensis]